MFTRVSIHVKLDKTNNVKQTLSTVSLNYILIINVVRVLLIKKVICILWFDVSLELVIKKMKTILLVVLHKDPS